MDPGILLCVQCGIWKSDALFVSRYNFVQISYAIFAYCQEYTQLVPRTHVILYWVGFGFYKRKMYEESNLKAILLKGFSRVSSSSGKDKINRQICCMHNNKGVVCTFVSSFNSNLHNIFVYMRVIYLLVYIAQKVYVFFMQQHTNTIRSLSPPVLRIHFILQ